MQLKFRIHQFDQHNVKETITFALVVAELFFHQNSIHIIQIRNETCFDKLTNIFPFIY